MKIELDGEELEMDLSVLTMEELDKLEKLIGYFYHYNDRCVAKTVGFSDVVNIYFHAQRGTAYPKEYIYKKVIKDGLLKHAALTNELSLHFLFGEKMVKELEEKSAEDTKKKEVESKSE